jgi:hypothetical protein
MSTRTTARRSGCRRARGRRASASQSFEPGERIWIGADLGGGERSTSAVYYLNERLPTQGYRAASS